MEASDANQKAAAAMSDDFPAGLRILVVDDSEPCIFILQNMLKKLNYQVTICHGALQALRLLREDKTRFDLVLSDLHMPEMSGIDLLRTIVSETDLPVVIMSADHRREVIMKGIANGACDYLIKPISAEVMQVMWQHIIRKKRGCSRMSPAGGSVQDDGTLILQHQQQEQQQQQQQLNVEYDNSNVLLPQQNVENEGENDGNANTLKRRKENEDESEVSDNLTNTKKRRIVWTSELHEKFIIAVGQLGGDKAVPKRILERMKEMNVGDLSRENVASHLQKYRLNIQKMMKDGCMDPNQSNFEQCSPSINPVSSADHHGILSLAGANPGIVAANPSIAAGAPICQRNILDGVPSFSQHNFLIRTDSGSMTSYYNLPLPVSEGYQEFNLTRRNLSVGNGLSIFSEPGGSGLGNLPPTVVNPIVDNQINNSFGSGFLGSNFYACMDIYNGATTATNDFCSPGNIDYASAVVSVPPQNTNLSVQIRKEPEFGFLENNTILQNFKDLPLAAGSYQVKGENMNEFISDQPETSCFGNVSDEDESLHRGPPFLQ